MLRLIHLQTQLGALLVDDIDDGLPNKTAHRMGSTADPKAYARDGYANKPKQQCYVPRVKPTDSSIAGYIDLEETARVLHSSGKGKILKMQAAGLISIISFVESDLNAPVITAVTFDSPAAGDVTIDGTSFLSVLPEITSVTLSGTGVGSVTLTAAQITAVAPGAVGDTQIIIDSTLVPGLAEGDSITVRADAQDSAAAVVPPTISAVTLDAPAVGDVTIDGAGLLGATTTTVRLYGAGVGDVTLTSAQITAVPPGAVGATQIIIDSTLIAGLTSGDNIVVTVDGTPSAATPVP